MSKDPASNYYGSSELVDKFTKAYIVNAALDHFCMDALDGTPAQNSYSGAIGDSKQMRDYILSEAACAVKKFTDTDLPAIPETGYQSNDDIVCQTCGKKYKLIASLRNHWETTACKTETETRLKEKKVAKVKKGTRKPEDNSDRILNYSKTALTLGLLKLDHDDAIKLGDGERILRLDSIMYLLYKRFHCTKYAYGMLETIMQSKVLLSERLAYRLIWNRVVNHRGKCDTNHPNDLDVEHCNKTFKEEAHSYRGVFTEKTLSRVSRSAMKTENILKNYDSTTKVVRPSGKHTFADVSGDIYTLVKQFKARQVFASIPGRAHSAFQTIEANQLQDLDMEDFRDWLGRSMTKISKKHFYNHS